MITSASNKVVIVGAGHGGSHAAALLRQFDHDGEIVLLGEEAGFPYQRPPLSKGYLKGTLAPADLLIKPEHFYRDQGITARLGVGVKAISPTSRELTLATGECVAFDSLILATGAIPRPLAVPGADLRGVHELRRRTEADSLATSLQPGGRLVVVGGGYVGLEVAASARHLGCEVVVLEREHRALARVASPELASFLVEHHRQQGTEVVTGAAVVSFQDRGDGTVNGVTLADGRVLPCDTVVVGVGALPCDTLAQDAGLACDGGIVVDDAARTSHPHVYAIGDVTRRPVAHHGGHHRLESIPSTVEQANQAVSAILGRKAPRPEVPWFWSDQYDVKIKIAGLFRDVDRTVLRGSTEDARFALFHFSGSRIVTVEAVSTGPEFMAGKKFIDTGIEISPEQLADPAVSLRDLMGSTRVNAS